MNSFPNNTLFLYVLNELWPSKDTYLKYHFNNTAVSKNSND